MGKLQNLQLRCKKLNNFSNRVTAAASLTKKIQRQKSHSQVTSYESIQKRNVSDKEYHNHMKSLSLVSVYKVVNKKSNHSSDECNDNSYNLEVA